LLRYNRKIELSDLSVEQSADSSGSEKLKLELTKGQKNGQFVLSVYGEVALQ